MRLQTVQSDNKVVINDKTREETGGCEDRRQMLENEKEMFTFNVLSISRIVHHSMSAQRQTCRSRSRFMLVSCIFCVRASICCVSYRKMVKNHMRKSACGAQRHRGEKSKSRFKRRRAKTKGNGRKSTIYPGKITWHKGRKRHLRGNFREARVQTNMMGAETVWKGNKTRRDKAPNYRTGPNREGYDK